MKSNIEPQLGYVLRPIHKKTALFTAAIHLFHSIIHGSPTIVQLYRTPNCRVINGKQITALVTKLHIIGKLVAKRPSNLVEIVLSLLSYLQSMTNTEKLEGSHSR